MTIDEKIKQAAEDHSTNPITQLDYVLGANFLKSEMLADMQKLAEIAKEAVSRIDCVPTCRSNSDSWLVKCSCGAEKKSKELRQALAEFNAKYKEQK